VQKLVEGVQQLQQHGIDVLYNQGQHEYQNVPWMQLVPETHWLHESRHTTANGWNLVGCDYQNQENFQVFLQSDLAKSADVLVCHQVWQDFMGELARPQAAFSDVPDNVKILITGDFHESKVLQATDEIPFMVLSPGSTHMRSIAEPENHFCLLLTLGDNHEFTVRSHQLFSRQCIRLTVPTVAELDFAALDELDLQKQLRLRTNTEAELQKASAYSVNLPPELHMPLIELTYREGEESIVEDWKRTFHEQAHLFFKCKRAKQVDELSEEGSYDTDQRVGLLDCLDSFVVQPATNKLAVAFLQNPDPEQTLRRWVEENAKP
jgi:hypothetical protein